jgi:predicted nucleic acid-binding protein
MISIAIVDSGPLVAVALARDPDHEACVSLLRRPGVLLAVPALCVAEASYLIGKAGGPAAEAAFTRGLDELRVLAPEPEDWSRIAGLVAEYADLRLGATDASVVALAERLNTDLIYTLDRRHFTVVRPRHAAALRLLPD